RVLDHAREQAVLDRLALLDADAVPPLGDALRLEDAQEVVLERQEELRRARVALPPRATAQLVVDPAALVPLRTDDVQPPPRPDPPAPPGALALEAGVGGRVLRVRPVVPALRERQELGIAAEHDVGAATRHVGRDRDRALAAGLGDDLGL